MIEPMPHGHTGAHRKEEAREDLSAQEPMAEKNIGLPGQGSKSHLREVQATIPAAKQPSIEEEETDQDAARDSLTGAVMENLKVGAGSAHETKEE